MKKWFLHILLLAGLFGMLTTSCSQEVEGLEEVVEKQKVMLRFTIALDEPKATSRSWNGYDEDDNTPRNDEKLGTIDENKINNVHALLYDLNGVLMGKLDTATPEVVESSANEHVYTVVGSVEVDADKVSNLDFKLMVLANCSSPANLNETDTHTFVNPNTTNGNGIPMWGIATYTGVDLRNSLTAGTAYDLTNVTSNQAPVYMLRSMAKIEVTLSEETIASGYSLSGASLNKSFNNGYVVPAYKNENGNQLTLEALAATTDLGIDEVFHPMQNGATTDNAVFTGSNNTFYIYVPEYDTSDNTPLEIGLTLTNGGSSETKSFKHGQYTDGSFQNAWDVIRNHYYKYTVSMKNGADLEVIIEINPWNYRDVTYDNTPLT